MWPVAKPTVLAPAKKPKDVQLAEIRWTTTAYMVERICGLLSVLVKSLAVLGVFFFVWKSVDCLSGKETKVSAIVQGVAKMSLDRWTAYILSGLFGLGFLNERRVRQKSISEKNQHIKKLEEIIDPGRSSSALDEKGRPKKDI